MCLLMRLYISKINSNYFETARERKNTAVLILTDVCCFICLRPFGWQKLLNFILSLSLAHSASCSSAFRLLSPEIRISNLFVRLVQRSSENFKLLDVSINGDSNLIVNTVITNRNELLQLTYMTSFSAYLECPILLLVLIFQFRHWLVFGWISNNYRYHNMSIKFSGDFRISNI